MDALTYVAIAAVAYVIGSISTGSIVARVYRNVDLTRVGSERTGATNALRALGIGAGIIVLLGDFAKGALAVWLAQHFVGTSTALGIAGFFSVVGHTRSIFLKGRGGRGVVTGLGGLAMISSGVFVVAAVVGSVTVVASRYVSLGSICGSTATVAAGLFAYFTGNLAPELVPYIVATPLYVIVAHGDNIARLRAGTERRLGQWNTGTPTQPV